MTTADLSVTQPAASQTTAAAAVRPPHPAGLRRALTQRTALARVASDAAILAVAMWTATTAAALPAIPVPPLAVLIAYPTLVILLFVMRRLYSPRLRVQVLDELRLVLTLTALAMMIVLSVRALIANDSALAAQSILLWFFAAGSLGAAHALRSWLQRRAWEQGEQTRPTLIVGAGSVGRRIAKRILDHPECGLRPVGFLDKDPLEQAIPGTEHLGILGASWDLEEIVAKHNVEHVLVSFSNAPHDVLLRVIDRCHELGVTVSLVPRLFEKVTARGRVEHFGGLPLLTISKTDPKGGQFMLKYAADRVFAAMGLLVTLPLLILAAVAIRIAMGSPVLFRQTRVGLDGKAFDIVKFRSMAQAPPPEGAVATNGSGPEEHDVQRVTPVGAFLRATSIDELPQLWNVLTGDMSVVGPRPERPEFTRIFEQHIYRYGDRHRVKSGITGWAQVHGKGRGDDRFSTDSLSDRVEWDNYYIENWSLWLDTKILLMTIAAVFHFRQS